MDGWMDGCTNAAHKDNGHKLVFVNVNSTFKKKKKKLDLPVV